MTKELTEKIDCILYDNFYQLSSYYKTHNRQDMKNDIRKIADSSKNYISYVFNDGRLDIIDYRQLLILLKLITI